MAEGEDNEGMPGVDRGPDSRLQVLLLVCLLRLIMSLLFRYKFRIKAENAYGISDESEESDPFDVNQPLSGKVPWFVLCLIAPVFESINSTCHHPFIAPAF